MGYSENLTWAQKAIAFVKANLPRGASNDPDNFGQLFDAATARYAAKAHMSAYEDNLMSQRSDLSVYASRELMIAHIAAVALKFKAGNCAEQAALAFIYLRDHKIFPIDYIEKPAKVGTLFGHAFVVVGRLKGSDPNKVETWGPDAVVCDPHQEKKAFPPADLPRYFGVPTGYTGLRLDGPSSVSIKSADVAEAIQP